jgi:hypothetical protein
MLDVINHFTCVMRSPRVFLPSHYVLADIDSWGKNVMEGATESGNFLFITMLALTMDTQRLANITKAYTS